MAGYAKINTHTHNRSPLTVYSVYIRAHKTHSRTHAAVGFNMARRLRVRVRVFNFRRPCVRVCVQWMCLRARLSGACARYSRVVFPPILLRFRTSIPLPHPPLAVTGAPPLRAAIVATRRPCTADRINVPQSRSPVIQTPIPTLRIRYRRRAVRPRSPPTPKLHLPRIGGGSG